MSERVGRRVSEREGEVEKENREVGLGRLFDIYFMHALFGR